VAGPTTLTSRFVEAFAYAARVHADDRRKGSDVPYLSHPMAVASLVLEHGGDEDQAVAALLHDVAEDHGGEERLSEIRARWGAAVERIVRDCSDSLLPEGAEKAPFRPRKQAYLERLEVAPDPSALVALADKLHNARCILRDLVDRGDALWDRFTAGREGALWYQGQVTEIFLRRWPSHPMAIELAEVEARIRAAAGAP
jgi:(p)ppGpp synthase/HD superfamily hydrolase